MGGLGDARSPPYRLMDFALTPEQDELVRALRVFAKRELAPRSGHWDKSGEFPWDVWRQMGELGMFGLVLPERYGGADAEFITLCVAIEELAKACATSALISSTSGHRTSGPNASRHSTGRRSDSNAKDVIPSVSSGSLRTQSTGFIRVRPLQADRSWRGHGSD